MPAEKVWSYEPVQASCGTCAPMSEPTTVSAEGAVMGTFDDHEDAHNMADVWNGAYPPSDGYPEFVVDGCGGECGYDVTE